VTKPGPQGENWTSWLNAFAYWEAGPSNEWAAIALSGAWGEPQVGQVVALAFAVVALGMGWAAANGAGMIATDGSIVCAATSLVISYAASKESPLASPPGVKMLNGASYLMDGGALVWDISELRSGA
jgi:hypothetical protein